MITGVKETKKSACHTVCAKNKSYSNAGQWKLEGTIKGNLQHELHYNLKEK